MANSRSVIDIIIRALWEGDQASKSAEQGLERVYRTAQLTGDKLQELPGISDRVQTALTELGDAARRALSLKPGTSEQQIALQQFEHQANISRVALENFLAAAGQKASPEGLRTLLETLNQINAATDAIEGDPTTVVVDLQAEELTQLPTQIAAIEGETVDIQVDAQTGELDALQTKLNALEGEVVDVKVNVNITNAEMLEQIEKTLDIIEKELADGLGIRSAEDLASLASIRKELLLQRAMLTTNRAEAKQLNEELAKEPPGSARRKVIEELKELQEALDRAREAGAETGAGFSPSDEDLDRLTMLRALLKDLPPADIDVKVSDDPDTTALVKIEEEPLNLVAEIERVDDEKLDLVEQDPINVSAEVVRIEDQKIEAIEGEVVEIKATVTSLDTTKLDALDEQTQINLEAVGDEQAVADVERVESTLTNLGTTAERTKKPILDLFQIFSRSERPQGLVEIVSELNKIAGVAVPTAEAIRKLNRELEQEPTGTARRAVIEEMIKIRQEGKSVFEALKRGADVEAPLERVADRLTEVYNAAQRVGSTSGVEEIKEDLVDLDKEAEKAAMGIASISPEQQFERLTQNLVALGQQMQVVGAQQEALINERIQLEAKAGNLTEQEQARLNELKVQIAQLGRVYRDLNSERIRGEEAQAALTKGADIARSIELRTEEFEKLTGKTQEAAAAAQEFNRTEFVDERGNQLLRTTGDEIDELIEAMKRRNSLAGENAPDLVSIEDMQNARNAAAEVRNLTRAVIDYDKAKNRSATGGGRISLAPVVDETEKIVEMVERANTAVATIGPTAQTSFGRMSRVVQGAGSALTNFGNNLNKSITPLQAIGSRITNIGTSVSAFGANLNKATPQVTNLTSSTNALNTSLQNIHPQLLKLNQASFPKTFQQLNGLFQQNVVATQKMADKHVLAAVKMAALEKQATLLNSKMNQLSKEVALGTKTINQAAVEYEEFAASMAQINTVDSLGSKLKNIGKNVVDLNNQWIAAASKLYFFERAIQTVTRTVRIFGNLLAEGANFDLLEQRFERLANEVGEDGEIMRLAIEDATGGLISSMEAMQLATQLLGLDLAQTADQAVRMSRVVTQLDQDVNELQLAISNQTTRRFDQLNVSVLGFEERLESLRESMAGMSEETIFTEAFLQQAEAQIDKIGALSGTTAASVREISASWKDLKTQLGENLAAEFGPVLADLTGQTGEFVHQNVAGMTQAADSVNDLRLAHERLLEVRQELINRDPAAYFLFISDDVNQENEKIAQALFDLTGDFEDFEAGAKRVFGSTGRAWQVMADGFFFNDLIDRIHSFGAANAEAFFELNKQVQATGYSMDQFLKIVEDLDPQMELTREEALKLAAALKEAEGADQILKNYGDEARKAALQTEELTKSFENLTDEIIKQRLESKRNELAERVVDGTLSVQQAEEQYDRYRETLESLDFTINRVAESQRRLNALQENQPGTVLDERAPFESERAKRDRELLEDRADLFEEFQQDLTEIDLDAGRERADLEAEYAAERVDIINDMGVDLVEAENEYQKDRLKTIEEYGRDLEKAERKFQNDKASDERKLAHDIEEVQRDFAKKRIEVEEEYYKDIQNLEEEHQLKRQRIIEDARDRMLDAYGSLDAAGIAEARRQRERDLRREQEDYERRRSEIGDTLEDALEEERIAEQERIDELKRRHKERQDEEARDYEFRKQEMKRAHEEELEELRLKNEQRLIDIRQEAFDERIELAKQHQLDVDQLKLEAEEKRAERQLEYEQERTDLDDQYDDLLGITEDGQKAILDAEELWWKQRLGLIDGTSGGSDGRTGGDHSRFDAPDQRDQEVRINWDDLPSTGSGVPVDQIEPLELEPVRIEWDELPSFGSGIPVDQIEPLEVEPVEIDWSNLPSFGTGVPAPTAPTSQTPTSVQVVVNITEATSAEETGNIVIRKINEFFEAL